MEIKFKNVSIVKTDNSSYINKIISNFDETFCEKNITSIVGKSGSGKSILMEILCGLIKPTKGEILIDDKKIDIDNIDLIGDKIGVVFQNPDEQFFMDTVSKEIEFGIRHLNKCVNDINKHILDSLLMVGLDSSYLNRKLNTLSSSEKRKVAIASVLAFNPKVIIFDEPTLDLDKDSIENLIKIIRLLKKKFNKNIIIISKNVDFVHKISDKVIVMYEGKTVLSGNKYDVFVNDLSKYGLNRPKVIEFEILAREKNVRLLYRDEINDLMKDIYRAI